MHPQVDGAPDNGGTLVIGSRQNPIGGKAATAGGGGDGEDPPDPEHIARILMQMMQRGRGLGYRAAKRDTRRKLSELLGSQEAETPQEMVAELAQEAREGLPFPPLPPPMLPPGPMPPPGPPPSARIIPIPDDDEEEAELNARVAADRNRYTGRLGCTISHFQWLHAMVQGPSCLKNEESPHRLLRRKSSLTNEC